MPGGSCVVQLLSITHEIYKSFDYNPSVDIRQVFLDIAKVFDKVWHDGLIFELQTYGVDVKLLKLLKSYLKDRQQRVLLNRQSASWKNILAGVSQGSVLGPLLFLININDLAVGLTSLCKLFSDDTSLFLETINRKKSEIEPNKDLKLISQRAYHLKMLFNPDPTKQATEVCFPHKRNNIPHEPLTFNDKIQSAPAQKYLGFILVSTTT